MSVTIADFQALQQQVIHYKTEIYQLQEQIENGKPKAHLSEQQVIDKIKADNVKLRIKINQAMKDKDSLTEKLRVARIFSFFNSPNMIESSNLPDINAIPENMRPTATEIYALIEKIHNQINRRAFLDTQVNELGKTAKTTGRVCDQIQSQVDDLRERQKHLVMKAEANRKLIQELEETISGLRQRLQDRFKEKRSGITKEELQRLRESYTQMEKTYQNIVESNNREISSLTDEIDAIEREIDDLKASKSVVQKKIQQKIWSIQSEVNRRRGFVVMSSKSDQKTDTTTIFQESKSLIETLATKQTEIWELEERIEFNKNSLKMLAEQLVLRKLGKVEGQKAAQIKSIAQNLAIEIAEMDRKQRSKN